MLIISRIIKNFVPVLAKFNGGISLVVQWLRFVFQRKVKCSIPGR